MASYVKMRAVKYVKLLETIPENELNLCLVVEVPRVGYKTATDVLPILTLI
jgi:hypothetical protein